MPCFGPLTGYYSKEVNPTTGKRSLVFDPRKANTGVKIVIPCGKCVGCRLEEGRQWAVRCMHEKRMYRESAFVTLTYADANLPGWGSLVKRDLQLFMKRLRKERPPGLRFFACGEYGEQTLRPHYHVLLLNSDFGDRRFRKTSPAGGSLYVSAELEKLWTVGNSWIGDVTPASAAYVAGYCVKKIHGREVDDAREPEFRVMSRRPGIGSTWLECHGRESYGHDNVVMNYKLTMIPRFYDSKWKDVDAVTLERVKKQRVLQRLLRKEDNTHKRLLVREQVELAKLKLFAREPS